MQKLPSTASAAQAAGLKRFFTGRPCRQGHIAERYAASGECYECAKIKAERHRQSTGRITQAEYYRLHKERINEGAARYRARTKIEKPWTIALHCSRVRAKEKGVPCDLTQEWAASVWTGVCAITGIPFERDQTGKSGPKPFSATIDRIDQTGGYLQGNCRFVLMCVNNFRGTLGDEDMRRVAAAIAAS